MMPATARVLEMMPATACYCLLLQGRVLEMSAGTGRNLPYYKFDQITSLTLSDVSWEMLQRAEDKYFDDLKVRATRARHGGPRTEGLGFRVYGRVLKVRATRAWHGGPGGGHVLRV